MAPKQPKPSDKPKYKEQVENLITIRILPSDRHVRRKLKQKALDLQETGEISPHGGVASAALVILRKWAETDGDS